jgi:hypothetical protein
MATTSTIQDHKPLELLLRTVIKFAETQQSTASLALQSASLDAPATVSRDAQALNSCLTKAFGKVQNAIVTFLEKPTVRRWINGEEDAVEDLAEAITSKCLTTNDVRRLLAATLKAGVAEDTVEGGGDTTEAPQDVPNE